MNYLEARMEERLSIIHWLEAEARQETTPSWRNAYLMCAKKLKHLASTSEVAGLTVRPITVPGK